MNRLKILLVDDNPEFLEVAAHFLSGHGALEIVGLANGGKEGLRMVEEFAPELVLMDISMPGINGLEATRQIKALPAPPRVIILTLYEGFEFCSFARDAGADHLITKSDFGESLLPAITRLFPQLQIEHMHECA
ncbi:MAG: chemotaxis protein CheY [Pedosphaera sp.]|jgi:CheY-like chemotaxis protein|nr:chemotaxis protein CheY [Pedosphaera sp.]